jgi:hypothetical protein
VQQTIRGSYGPVATVGHFGQCPTKLVWCPPPPNAFRPTFFHSLASWQQQQYCMYLVYSGVFRNLERGGAARIFGDFFLGRRPTSKIPVRKHFDDLFLVTFTFFSTSPRRPPQKPAKRHPPHHELQLRGGGPGPPPA